MTQIEKIISEQKDSINIHEFAFMKSNEVVFSDEVRRLCEKNACGGYGTSWACPPAVGSVEECKEICGRFENAFIFTTVTKLKNKYDVVEWREARVVHEKITDKVAKIFRDEFEKTLILSTEGCTICKKCTYPDEPCRFPDKMYPATESFGIMVAQQASICKIRYINGPDTITYFSMIFFDV
jgi:predicted metal-binding protein